MCPDALLHKDQVCERLGDCDPRLSRARAGRLPGRVTRSHAHTLGAGKVTCSWAQGLRSLPGLSVVEGNKLIFSSDDLESTLLPTRPAEARVTL